MPNEPVVVAEPIVEPAEALAKAPAEPTELEKALSKVTELEADRDRLTQRLSSEEGRSRKGLSAEDYAESFRREMRRANDLTSKQLEVFLRANVPEGDRPVVEQALAKVQQQAQTEAAEDAAAQEANELYRDLLDEAQDAGLDLATAPELLAVRNIWNQGWGREGKLTNLSHMRAAVREARQVRRSSKARPSAEPAKKTSIPAPKAAGSPTAKSEEQRYADFAAGKTDDYKWAKGYRDKLQRE